MKVGLSTDIMKNTEHLRMFRSQIPGAKSFILLLRVNIYLYKSD